MSIHWRYVSLLLVVLLTGAGCSAIKPPTAEQLDRGCILLLPGVSGPPEAMGPMIAGLREGGVERAIDVDRWGVKVFGAMANLTDYDQARKEAARLAGKLVEYRKQHPFGPVSIVGYSGGGGVAVFTAEALPPDFALDRVVLIAAAISPHYDLSKTIAHCRHGVVNVYSELDWGRLGMGTETFGTMDRVKTPSAGYVGFANNNDQLLKRDGLEQIPWVTDWRRLGHGGDHFGYLARPWAREVLAPLLRLEPAATGPSTEGQL